MQRILCFLPDEAYSPGWTQLPRNIKQVLVTSHNEWNLVIECVWTNALMPTIEYLSYLSHRALRSPHCPGRRALGKACWPTVVLSWSSNDQPEALASLGWSLHSLVALSVAPSLAGSRIRSAMTEVQTLLSFHWDCKWSPFRALQSSQGKQIHRKLDQKIWKRNNFIIIVLNYK